MKDIKIDIAVTKQTLHGIIPYLIAFLLYCKGISGFAAVTAGALYIIFAGYIYLFIKKEEPAVFITMAIFYFIAVSGW